MNNIGYACKVVGVRDTDMRACTLATATPEKLANIALHNIAALGRMIKYNIRVDIRLCRISSDLIPLATHPDVCFDWRQVCAGPLRDIGRRIREAGLRVSMHPGQYTVLNSPRDDVAQRAAEDLVYHAAVLDSLDVSPEAKIILHVGGVYGDRTAALKRFAERCAALPEAVTRRLVLENDEKCFAVHEVCGLAESLGLPVVLDVFHHALNPAPRGTGREWLARCASTWKQADGRQKIHYSEQLAGGRPGMHSRTINAARFAAFYAETADLSLDIMLEVKDKNLSALKCLHCVRPNLPRRVLTDAWAAYKYAVLEHSPRHYGLIREYLKAEMPEPIGFYALVDEALESEPTPGTIVGAAEHVWGYFKKDADAGEKRDFTVALDKVRRDGKSAAGLKRLLRRAAERRNTGYLLDGLYFYL